MSERWKPKHGEAYYFFNSALNVDREPYKEGYAWDGERIAVSNCFKTREEAKAAAEKVKALLLSLHETATECSQLPKLTAEVFDRPDCPEWAKYAAVDSNGAGYYYSEKPFILSDAFGWCMVCSENNRSELISCEFNNSDWQNSLIERPVALPDWCKVGEWVYSTEYKEYVQISDIDEFEVSLSSGAYCSVGHKSFLEDYRPARLRPYNADEIPDLPFEVSERNSNFRTTIVSCQGDKVWLAGATTAISTEELLSEFTIKGKICGVFEHLENGEWVE